MDVATQRPSYEIEKVGVFTPKDENMAELTPGEVGLFTAGNKAVADCNGGRYHHE